MVSPQPADQPGPRLSSPVVLALCAAAVVGAVIIALMTLGSSRSYYATSVKNTSANPQAVDTTAWLRQKAQESGGDFSRLSPADQAKANQLTRGAGASVLKVLAGKR